MAGLVRLVQEILVQFLKQRLGASERTFGTRGDRCQPPSADRVPGWPSMAWIFSDEKGR